jgi:hypothetical protein
MRRLRRTGTAAGQSSAAEAPPAAFYQFYDLLNTDDISDALSLVGTPATESLLDVVDSLNEGLSDFLFAAEPGTVGRASTVRRYNWFEEVGLAARRLEQLLQPLENSALLLSGVGQPMLFLSAGPLPRLSLSEWKQAILSAIECLQLIAGHAEHGRQTLERGLYEVRTDVSGRLTVLERRRQGRPADESWPALAAGLMDAWRRATGKESTVVVDPMTDPPSRRSPAAAFGGRLLDIAAERLPADKRWAVDRFRGQEAKLIEHLETQRKRRQSRPHKRGKSISE